MYSLTQRGKCTAGFNQSLKSTKRPSTHFSVRQLILHLQLECSKHYMCAPFISAIYFFEHLFSIHEFWWLIAKNRRFFTDFFLIQKQSYHFTEIKIHFFRFSRGGYTSVFMKHKRMLFLVRFHRKSNQLSPSAFSAKKYGWTEKQSAGHSTKTGAKCWWSDWKVFSAVNNTVDWFM